MPIYVFKCPVGHKSEQFFRVKDMPQSVNCDCGETAKKIITSCFFTIDNFQGYDMSLGKSFSNGNERKQYMREKNYVDIGPEDQKKALDSRKQLIEERLERGHS